MTEEKRKERVEKLADMDGETLLENYDFYVRQFNPLDEEFCETFHLIKAEVLKRLNGSKEDAPKGRTNREHYLIIVKGNKDGDAEEICVEDYWDYNDALYNAGELASHRYKDYRVFVDLYSYKETVATYNTDNK